MAWGKRALVPLKVIAVTAEQSVIWDTENDKVTYLDRRERDDPDSFDQLKFRQGEEPIVFTLRPGLAPGIVARIKNFLHPECALVAFQFGVAACSHAAQLGLRWTNDGDAQHIDIKTMGKVPPKVWTEIGNLVLKREDLTEGE